MATLTNQNGTGGIDILNYTANGTYHANGGNDTINIKGGSIVIYTDSGNNTINITGGKGHNVKVAADATASNKINGIEKLTVNGGDAVDAILGSGKDEIVLTNTNGRKTGGALGQIRGGDWGDTFTVNNGTQNYQLYGEAGDDKFIIKGGSGINFWGGAANDTFEVTGGQNNKIYGGDSKDTFNVSVGQQTLILGYGNDEVNINAGDKQNIAGNLGINTINLNAGSGHIITADIDRTLSKKKGFTDAQIAKGEGLGYGVDKVYITGTAKNVTANLGDGKDVVSIAGGSGHIIYTEGWGDEISISSGSAELLDAGEGDNTFKVQGGKVSKLASGNGKDTLTITDGYVSEAFLGGGQDNLTITGGTLDSADLGAGNDIANVEVDNVYIAAGAGDDTVMVGVVDGTTVEGGTGKDTLTVKGGFGNTLKGEADNDNLTIEDGRYNVLYGGEGNDTLTVLKGNGHTLFGGAGKDTYIIDWTNTSDITINNNGTGTYEGDVLQLTGIKSGEASIKLSDTSGFLTIEDSKGKVLRINGWAENRLAEITFSDGVAISGDTINKTGETINVSEANQFTKGTKRNDTITLNKADNSNVSAGEGDDIINITDSSDNYIFAEAGDDTINAKNITDGYIWGQQGNDKLVADGTLSNVVLSGGSGNDSYEVNWTYAKQVIVNQGDAADTDKDSLIIRNLNYSDLKSGKIKAVYDGLNDRLCIYAKGEGETATVTQSIYITSYTANALNSIAFVKGSQTTSVTAGDLMKLAEKRNLLAKIDGSSSKTYTLKEDEGGIALSDQGWNVAVTGMQENFALDFTAYKDKAVAVRFVKSKTAAGDGVVELGTVAKDGTFTAIGKLTIVNGTSLSCLYINRWNGKKAELISVEKVFEAESLVGVGTALNFKVSANEQTITLNYGTDTVNVTGNSNNINGCEGNDVIYVNGKGNTIDGGAGTNTISILSGTENEVYVSEGDNTITVSSSGNTVYGFNTGKNKINVKSDENIVYLLYGENTINIEGNNNSVNGSSENDIINIKGSNNTVAGGSGQDSYSLQWSDSAKTYTDNIIDNTSTEYDKDTLTISGIASTAVYFVYHDTTGDLTVYDSAGNSLTIKAWYKNPLASIKFEKDGVLLSYNEINDKAAEGTFTITQAGTYNGKYMDNINITGIKGQAVINNLQSGVAINLTDTKTNHAVQYSWSGNDLLLRFYTVDGSFTPDGSMLIKNVKPTNSSDKYTCTVRGFYNSTECNTVSLNMSAGYKEAYMFILAGDVEATVDNSIAAKYIYGNYGSNTYNLTKNGVVLAESKESVTVNVAGSNSTVTGSSAADIITVSGSNNVVNTLAGRDVIEISGANNHVSGGYGLDTYKVNWDTFSNRVQISERQSATSVDGTRNMVIIDNAKADELIVVSKSDVLMLFDNTGKRMVVDGWTKSQAGTSIVNLSFTEEKDAQGNNKVYTYTEMKELADKQQNTTVTSKNITSSGVYTTGLNCQKLVFSGSNYTAYITDFTNSQTASQWDAANYKSLDFSAYADGKHTLKTSRDNYDLVFEVADNTKNNAVIAKIVMAEAYMLDGFYSYNTMMYNGSWSNELISRAFEDTTTSSQLLVAGK